MCDGFELLPVDFVVVTFDGYHLCLLLTIQKLFQFADAKKFSICDVINFSICYSLFCLQKLCLGVRSCFSKKLLITF